MTRFGQLVIGPPGSGKTTYVGAMAELLRALGRKVATVNLDPANEIITYSSDVDIADFVKVEEVMDQMKLGPIGGLFAMEFFHGVNLVDSHHCSDPSKFISVCLTSLTAMLQISLPHINLLSKVDLVEKYGKLHFNLDYYTDVLDLEYMLETLPDDNFTKKYKQLNEALTGRDYSLLYWS